MKRLGLIALILAAVLVTAQDRPQTVNGNVEDRPLGGKALASAIQGVAPSGQVAWVGYAVPIVDSEQHLCCFNFQHMDELRRNRGCCGGCKLERSGEQSFTSGRMNDCPPSGDQLFVTVRVNGGKVEKIQSYTTDCQLDLGGKTLYWLGNPPAAESLAWLAGFAARYDHDDDRLADGALSAIAFHKDAGADAVLQRFVAPTQDRKLREQAAFWLGNTRGQRGFEIVRDAIRNDQDAKFREEATFALSQSEVPAAEQELVRLARQDPDHEVRGQALFWLAQKAGQKVAKVITDAIENDPDTEVKKKAVFSLSQMEDNEGVPLLISVAKTNKNPVVRKEAIFWLGQSNDSRALDYIESILTK